MKNEIDFDPTPFSFVFSLVECVCVRVCVRV